MKDFNLDFLQKEVGTKYNDMVGLAALDGHLSTVELQDLCKQQGVDLDKYDLVGLEFLDGETIGRYPISVIALFTKKEEELDAETTKIYKKRFYITYSDLGKYIKRLNFAVDYKDIAARIINPEFVDM